jgi:hypothetical protein
VNVSPIQLNQAVLIVNNQSKQVWPTSSDAFSDDDRRLFERVAGEMGPLYD